MAFNRRPAFIFITVLFLMGLVPLSAQNSGDYLEGDLVQRLRWIGDEYAMRYEVIIEKEKDGVYERVLREFTAASFIEVSLSHGKYRYQVIPYDFFNSPVHVTEWMDFEVLSANDRFKTAEPEIALAPPADETGQAEVSVPDAESPLIETESSATEEVTSIARQNQFDLYLSAAWLPLLPAYGVNQFFGNNLSLFGMAVKFGILSRKQSSLKYGLELSVSWRIFEAEYDEQAVQLIAFDLNLLAQLSSPGNRLAINIRPGVGVSLLPFTRFVPSADQYFIYVNLGISFPLLITKSFFLETGIEYSQFLAYDHFGFFRYWIGVGWQF